VASKALELWRTERADRLDQLLLAHRLVGGPSRGRRWRTAALNDALILRLAAEFQGFARDLHDLACDQLAAWAAPTSAAVESVIRNRLREGRDLDRGNAHPGVVGKDFGRFGFEVWPALARRDPSSTRHNASLERLNAARNAVAHDDAAALTALRIQGYPLVLATYRQWRRDLNALAGNLDGEVSLQLGRLFGRPGPW
jgi:hypothetical protein